MTTDRSAAGDHRDHEPRVAAWEVRAQWFLVVAAAVFLAAYTCQVLAPGLVAPGWLDAAMWVSWALFAADFAGRLALARRRFRFLRRNLLDVVVVVLPVFQQLRLLRIVTMLTTLNRVAHGGVRRNVGIYTAGSTLLLGYCSALAVLEAERGAPGASIRTFPDALWWTITTITTVGYGDYAPITAQGKLIAAGLMLGGITLLGVVTASIASWFVEHIQGSEERHQREEASLRAELSAVRTELAEVRAALAEVRGASGTGGGTLNGHRESAET